MILDPLVITTESLTKSAEHDDLIVRVDDLGAPLGPVRYHYAHRNGIFHRTINTLAFTDYDYKTIRLSRRGSDVERSGAIDCTAGGHSDWVYQGVESWNNISSGEAEKPEETLEREVAEELFGGDTKFVSGIKFTPVPPFRRYNKSVDGRLDCEVTSLFVWVYDDKFKLKNEEVATVETFDFNDAFVDKILNSGTEFTSTVKAAIEYLQLYRKWGCKD